jgi:glycerol kinase
MLIFCLFQKKYENLKKVCLDGCVLISNAGIQWLSDIIDGATQLEQVKYRSNLL